MIKKRKRSLETRDIMKRSIPVDHVYSGGIEGVSGPYSETHGEMFRDDDINNPNPRVRSIEEEREARDPRSNGLSLNLSDWNTWNKYRPEVYWEWSNKFQICITFVCPPRCSTAEMRQFRYGGVDLMIGYDEPSNDRFLHCRMHLNIDGYNNNGWIDLNNYSAGQHVRWTLDLASCLGLASSRPIYTRNYGEIRLTYGNWSNHLIRWAEIHDLMRSGTNIFIRPWVRTKYFSEASSGEQNSVNGFLYAGYENFNRPGQEGHTFNNGLMIKCPVPVQLFGTSAETNPNTNTRLSDFDIIDGKWVAESNLRCRTFYDPFVNVYRAPSSGTSAAMTWNNNSKLTSAEYNVQPIIFYPDGSAFTTGWWIYQSNTGNSLGVYLHYYNIVPKNLYGNRAQSTQQVVIYPNYSTGGSWIVDFSGGHYGGPYSRTQPIMLSGGTGASPRSENNVRKDQYYVYDALPGGARTFKDVWQTRSNNGELAAPVVNPYQANTGWSNMASADGEGLHTENSNGILRYRWNCYSGIDTSKTHEFCTSRDAPVDMNALITALHSKYPSGTNLEYATFFIRHQSHTEYNSDSIRRGSNWVTGGDDGCGFIIESPVKSIAAKDIRANPRFETVSGQKVLISNTCNIRIDCNARAGTDKAYMLTFGISSNGASLGNPMTTIAGIGSWRPDSDPNAKWANSSYTNTISCNLFDKFWKDVGGTEGFSRKYNVRRKLVTTWTEVITKGRWVYGISYDGGSLSGIPYDVPEGTPNSNWLNHSTRYYIPAYADCSIAKGTTSYSTSAMTMAHAVTITDVNLESFFHVKRAWVVVTIAGQTKTHTEELIANAAARTYSNTRDSKITAIMTNICGSLTAAVGKTATFTVHSNGNYEFMDTSDGTRDGNSNGSTTAYVLNQVFDIVPACTLSCAAKGESFTFAITKGNYPANMTFDLYVRVNGTTTWTAVGTNYANNQNIAYNPATHFNVSNRGKKFDVRIYAKGNHGAAGGIEFINKFTWNEIPSVTINSVTVGVDGSGYETISWSPNCGNKITAVTKLNDGDTNSMQPYIKYGTNKAYGGASSLAANGTLTTNITADNMAASISGMYPVDLTQKLSFAIQAKDAYNQMSNVATAGSFKMLTPIKRSGYAYDAVSGHSTKTGDTVYGTRVTIKYNMTHVASSKFNDTDWKYRHWVDAKELGASDSAGFYVAEKTHDGINIPASISFDVDLKTNSNFKPGKIYQFRVYTRVVRYNGSTQMGGATLDDRIYQSCSSYYGKVSYGTKPLAPKITYPLNNSVFNCTNPSLIVDLPNQTDVTNNSMQIGFAKGANAAFEWFDQNNIHTKGVLSIIWRSGVLPAGTHKLRIQLKSKITGLVSDIVETNLTVTSLNLAKSAGDQMVILNDIRNEANRLRTAYGLANASFESNSAGTYITFNNAISTIVNAYSDVINRINSFIILTGNTAAVHMSIPNNTHMLADATTHMNNKLKLLT